MGWALWGGWGWGGDGGERGDGNGLLFCQALEWSDGMAPKVGLYPADRHASFQ